MKPKNPFSLFSFIFLLSEPSLTAWLPTKSTSRILTFGPSVTWNVTCTSFVPALNGLRSPAGSRRTDSPRRRTARGRRRRHAADLAGIDEGVEPDRDALLLQLLFDLRLVDFLQTLVVDDLDPLALLHVVDDHLADDAVREAVILDADREVVEEVRRPQALEVFADDLLGRFVVRNPLVVGSRSAGTALDVVQVGVGPSTTG